MRNCLYCDEVPKSEEHPLPAALGEFSGAPILVDRICKRCNERRIGLLDEQFVRCGPAAIFRKRFGIKGREHHDEVNPFYRGSAGGHRIKYVARDESFQCDVLMEITHGNQGRQLTQLILKGQSGPHQHISLTPTMTIDVLRQQIAALQLVAPLDARLICDPPTEQWAVELFRQLWPEAILPESTVGATGFLGGLVQFQITNRYFRAIAKIGFHYFLTQFPNYSGHEHMFDDIRDFISDDVKELLPTRINHFIGVHRSPVSPASTGFVGHLLCAEIQKSACLAHFEPFVTPGGRMQAFMVRIATDPTGEDSVLRSHMYLYYGQGKSGRYSGDALEIDPQQINLNASHYDSVIASL